MWQNLYPCLRRNGAAAMMGAAMVVAASGVAAAETCKPLFGHFESQFAPAGCTSPVGFCTTGTVIGGLQGSFDLTVETFLPVAAVSSRMDSPVAFFVGESVIHMKDTGETLVGTDTGALDQVTGQIGTLLTFTGGTGAFDGASGHIIIQGTADFATGANIGDYRGEVCTAG